MMAYYSSVYQSTGFSPNEMMLGHEAFLPLDLGVEQAELTGNRTTTVLFPDVSLHAKNNGKEKAGETSGRSCFLDGGIFNGRRIRNY